jgi:putative ABC transport system permease protein
LLLGLLLLVIPGYMIYAYDRLSWRAPAIAVVRMLVQLSAMGALLWAVYRYDSVWLCLLWLLLLVMASSFLMVSRSGLNSRTLFLPACVSMFVSVLVVSLYLLYAVFGPAVDSPFCARWFVPVTGVLMAHVLTTNIPAVRTFFDCLRQDRQPYLTVLGNGASQLQALAPYITRALRSLTIPAVGNLSALGLCVLPMLLSGLLLGGMEPLQAVCTFVVLMLGCIAASVLSLVLILWLVNRKELLDLRKESGNVS